ncbi:MAG TPA: response regulator, partial [Anaerolineaceae bacterium]|nr:response regulator [Anaerolineaceae bacterium]
MKIIAIDDNKDNLLTLKAIIKDNFQDAEVVTTTSGKQGVEEALSFDPDVIILDIIMPGMDGFEVCQILKSEKQTQDIPVIFLTALRENKENRLRALEVGGDAFLTKPIDEPELVAQIRAMSKLKKYSDQNKHEKTNLEQLVKDKTEELQRTHFATLNLLEDLHEENETRKKKESELIESENSFRSLFEDSPVAIFEEDFSETIQLIQSYKDKGITNFRNFFKENPEKLLECIHTVKILNANRSAVDLYDAKDKEELFVSLPLMAFVEDGQDRLDEFVNIAEGKTHFNLEIINNTFDKSRKYLSLHWGVVRGYEADCSKVIVSLVDITDRKLSEIALKESETRFRNLFENSPVSIWEEDFSEVKKYLDQLKASGVEDIEEYFSNNQSELVKVADLIEVTDVNKETLRLYGATSKEELKQSISKIFTKRSLDQFIHQLLEISSGKTHFDLDFTNKTIDGRVLEFTAKWAAVPGYENDLSKVLISMIDITDRKKAEVALRENEQRYRSLFDDSPVAIFEEDVSAVKRRIDELKLAGIEDFREFLTTHPDELTQLIRLIKITDLNKEAEKLYGLESKEGFDGFIRQVSPTFNVHLMVEEFVNIANGFTKFQTEIKRLDEEG